MTNKLILCSILITVAFLLPKAVFATDFTSTNFKVKDPVFQVGGQKSTSTSFQLLGSIGQISIGTSTSSSFKGYSGFFYFPVEAATSTTFNFTTGGSITLTNINNTSAVFSIPSNFYSENLSLQASSYSNNFFTTNKPLLSGKNFIGKTYDFNFYTTSGSSVSAVSKAITITLSYTDDDISGFDESTLVPYRWGASDSSWQLISGATVDTANNKITFSTTNFSSFTLFAPTTTTTPAPAVVATAGGNFSLYLESLVKTLAITPIIKKIKPCDIIFDLNCDNKVDVKDFSIFLASETQPTLNPKTFSVFLSAWTEKFTPFVSKTIPSEIGGGISKLFNLGKTAAISLLAKPSVKTPQGTTTVMQKYEKPNFIKNAVQFISNIFSNILKLFKK